MLTRSSITLTLPEQGRVEALRRWMSVKQTPTDLQNRVLQHIVYLQSTADEPDHSTLSFLPPHLRMDVLVALEGGAIRKIPFFYDCVDTVST
jgi:hypothetical protein